MKHSNIPNKILYWYDKNKRNLPWRKKTTTKNREYFTLVSEFMLQQTQVKTVIPYFVSFIKNFPNLKSLANAKEERVLKIWEGLGYYSRARNLKKTANKLINDFDSKLPEDIEALMSLPGIGEYTSRSILAIAHNKPYIPMDGNVERILKRIFLLKKKNEIYKDNLNKKKSFFSFSKRSSDYAQAIMEIGAVVCKPKLPLCNLCPISENCKAFKFKDFVIKPKDKFNKTKYFEANVYSYKNKYLLIKNKKFNFLKNFFIFPMTEINKKKFNHLDYKKINVKISNMKMKIVIKKNKKLKKIRDSLFLDKTNMNNYILPSFTKKIFNSVSQ